jgi:hypothetical protein
MAQQEGPMTPFPPFPINIGLGPEGFEVHPNIVFVRTGDSDRIGNATNYRVEVTFPPEIVTGGQTLHLQPGQEEPFTVTGSRRGIFEYFVSVLLGEDSTTRAQGGSNPRIIIT